MSNQHDPRENQATGIQIWSWLLLFFGGMLLIGFLFYAVVVDELQTWASITGGVGAAMVIGWLVVEWERLRTLSTRQGARFTSMALMLLTLGLGISVAANVIASRYDKRWDLTENQRFSLSEQTVSILDGLDQEIEVLAFFARGSVEESDFKSLIVGYEQHSTLLNVRYLDPIRNPIEAEEHHITSQFGTVILRAGDATQQLESAFDEEALTNALVRVTAGVEHNLCFAEGHGELDPEDAYGQNGLGVAVGKIEGQNYTYEKVSLLREGRVPAQCEILIAADPQYDWHPAELEMTAAFVAAGGKFLLMLEPGHADALAMDMSRYGIDIGHDLVLEVNPTYQIAGGDPSYILLDRDSMDFHPITESMDGQILMVFVRSVHLLPDFAGINGQELAHTTSSSWGETDLTNSMPEPDGADRAGPVSVMVAVEITDPELISVGSTTLGNGRGLQLPGAALDDAEADDASSVGDIETAGNTPADATVSPVDIPRAAGGQVVVIGDVDFATNALLTQGNNLDLILNSVAWMAGETDQLSIRPNEASESGITINLVQTVLVWLICLLVAPGLAIGGAINTWRIRRQR